MNSKYIGLTIGPLIKTLEQVKSTRALFCASYLYSYAMGEFLEQLVNKGKRNQIVLPAPDRIQGMGVGLHPDRMIMMVEASDDFQNLLNIRADVIDKIYKGIQLIIPHITKQYLEQYFQFYCLEGEFSSLKAVNEALNTLELRAAFPDKEKDEIRTFLNTKTHNFLLKDAGIASGKFPSLIEIATRELRKIDKGAYEEIIEDALKREREKDEKRKNETDIEKDKSLTNELKATFGKAFKPYHKYIATIYVDGDNMGKHGESLKPEKDGNQKFSEELRDFGIKAKKLIEDYGGKPVYIGGDDLMFFAPIKYDENKNIFSLMEALDNEFKSVGTTPTLSYGISITYYKYPMNEALELSHNLLEEMAKKYYSNAGKNAFAFDLVKHSGQSIKCSLQKGRGKQAYPNFLKMLNTQIKNNNFINSITYTLDFHEQTIEYIMTQKASQTHLKNFFDNNFNEKIHDEHRDFINKVAELIIQLYHERNIPMPANIKPIHPLKKLYAMLRFIHFVTSDEQ